METHPIDNTRVYNDDCMIGMSTYPSQYFDLAIADPPYGIGENWKKDRYSKFYKHESSYKNACIPDGSYFAELFRVSKNQIFWGANYYTEFLPARNSWIVWDKMKDFDSCNMAEGELAWTSLNVPLRFIRMVWNGFIVSEPRNGNHPHEKPTNLYRWLLKNYAKEGDKILDTHLGSQSSRIAAFDLGYDFTGYELDKDYFDAGNKRFNQHKAQLKLFTV